MIIANLIGGLGNQMFQYAHGRALAIRNNTELKLDVSGFRDYNLRHYELGAFPIAATIATPEDINALKGNPLLTKLGMRKSTHVIERTPDYNGTISSDNVYIEGYWQSEKYFSAVSDAIRNDFKFIQPSSADCIRLLKQIVSFDNPVCVHVRRGDYVSNPETKAYHTTQGKDYYLQAMAEMRSRVKDPHFFLFCDEPLSCSLDYVDNYTYSHIGTYETFYLMSRCKHHIIANSSYSWWAAWLGETPQQVVVAPKKWYNVERSTRDLIPERWVTI